VRFNRSSGFVTQGVLLVREDTGTTYAQKVFELQAGQALRRRQM